MKRYTLILWALLNTVIINAQDIAEKEAGTFTANGKSNVVFAILGIILIGIFVFLISLDRRLRRIEKEQ